MVCDSLCSGHRDHSCVMRLVSNNVRYCQCFLAHFLLSCSFWLYVRVQHKEFYIRVLLQGINCSIFV